MFEFADIIIPAKLGLLSFQYNHRNCTGELKPLFSFLFLILTSPDLWVDVQTNGQEWAGGVGETKEEKST